MTRRPEKREGITASDDEFFIVLEDEIAAFIAVKRWANGCIYITPESTYGKVSPEVIHE